MCRSWLGRSGWGESQQASAQVMLTPLVWGPTLRSMVVNVSQDGSNQVRGFEGAREKVIQFLVPFTPSLPCFAFVVAIISLISNVCLPFFWLLLESCILNKAHPDLKLSLSGPPPTHPSTPVTPRSSFSRPDPLISPVLWPRWAFPLSISVSGCHLGCSKVVRHWASLDGCVLGPSSCLCFLNHLHNSSSEGPR